MEENGKIKILRNVDESIFRPEYLVAFNLFSRVFTLLVVAMAIRRLFLFAAVKGKAAGVI